MHPSYARRLVLLAALYVSQAVPLGFFIVAVPAVLRSRGLSLESVGLLGALALPWLLKFLWAPLVDRYGAARGHYRSWILPLQTACVVSVLAIAFVDLDGGMPWLFVAGAAFMLFSATQDIAADGLAVSVLQPSERGVANGVQVGGYYLGQIAGGGVVLLLYSSFGWTPAVLFMALLLGLAMIPVWSYPEPERPAGAPSERTDFAALKRFFARPGAGLWALVLVLFRAGEAMALTMFNPLLVDRGLALDQIGLALGVVGSLGSLAGALLGGLLLQRLGRRVSLVVFGVFQSLALLGYLAPARGFVEMVWVMPVVAVAACAGGLATAALYTCMMDRCDPRTPATDFTLQQSLAAIGPMIGATTSGVLAAAIGYELLFVLSSAIVVAAVALVVLRLTPSVAAPSQEVQSAEGVGA
ncbi:MAG: MFS transporter [Acidobacteriota bacterium]